MVFSSVFSLYPDTTSCALDFVVFKVKPDTKRPAIKLKYNKFFS